MLGRWKAHPRDPLAPASLTFDGRRIPGILHGRALPSSPHASCPPARILRSAARAISASSARPHPPRLSLNHLRAYTSSPRRDEWRRHPMVGNPLRHTTPGLDIAIVGFGIYLIVEAAYNRLKRPSGNHHH
ncbi:NADH dehydrogenase [ubiquinone] 1 beta subcomplex subunit 3-A [Zea mays]|nr:NADH dehydrogenase [ubiquinone] 1 beta subcomplex subunit 3-A [Zea mays]